MGVPADLAPLPPHPGPASLLSRLRPWPSLLLTPPVLQLLLLGIGIVVIRLAIEKPSGYFLISLVCVYALGALGLNVILGMGGLLTVAQAAVMSVGGYAIGIGTVRFHFPLGIAFTAAILASAAVSAFTSLAAIRVRSHYFILVTLGVAEAIGLFEINQTDLTGGNNGFLGIEAPYFGPVLLARPFPLAVSGLVLLAIGWYVADAFQGSRLGRSTIASGADEHLAASCGMGVGSARLAAAALGGAYAGVGGILFAETLQFMGPGDFGLDTALLLLLIVVIGGMGSNLGTIVAAAILTYLTKGLLGLTTVGPLVYGTGIMLLLVLAPGGLAGLVRRSLGRLPSQHRGTVEV